MGEFIIELLAQASAESIRTLLAKHRVWRGSETPLPFWEIDRLNALNGFLASLVGRQFSVIIEAR